MFYAQILPFWYPTPHLCWLRGFEHDSNPFKSPGSGGQISTCLVVENHNSTFIDDCRLKPFQNIKTGKSSQIEKIAVELE
jgi:hypothetical protein